MIFCRACNNELWWEEEDTAEGKIYYVGGVNGALCDECDSKHIDLYDAVRDNFKAIEGAIVALSANVIATGDTGETRKIALRSLKSIAKIEDVLQRIGG